MDYYISYKDRIFISVIERKPSSAHIHKCEKKVED